MTKIIVSMHRDKINFINAKIMIIFPSRIRKVFSEKIIERL